MVDLSHNKLIEMPDCSQLLNLTVLNLSFNEVYSIIAKRVYR